MSKTQTWIVRGATALVAVVAMLLSYHALALRALGAGIPGSLAWIEALDGVLAAIYPLAIDGLLVVGMVGSFVMRRARRRTRGYVWAVTGVGLLVSLLGNAPSGLLPGDTLLLRMFPPLALALTLHLLIVLSRDERIPRAKRAPEHIEPARPVIVKPLPPSGEESRTALARRLLELDPDMSSDELRRRGVKLTDSSIRRLRSEARNSERPRTAVSG